MRVTGDTYRVTLQASGTIDRLNLAFTSDPWLPQVAILALLFSGLGRQPRAIGFRETHSMLPHALAASAVLQSLDRVEYRRIDLGTPWPVAVIGPTGVTIVAVATSAADQWRRRIELDALVETVRQRVHDADGRREVPVRLLVVVPSHDHVAASRDPQTVVTADLLRDRLVRGEVLPMPTVDQAVRRLAGLTLTPTPTS